MKTHFLSRSALLALLVLCLGPTSLSAAISIDQFAASTNDRFANSGGFVATGQDLSGVGRTSNGRWLVMISPNVFLTAAHSPAGPGLEAYFYPGNDPADTPFSATVASIFRIGSTDLLIGTLDAAVPTTIRFYPIADQAITEATFQTSEIRNQNVLLSGISPTTSSYGAAPRTNQAVGTNRVELFQENLEIASSTGDVIVTVRNQAGDAGYTPTPFEADLNSGDSGSPLLWDRNGTLTVAGIAIASGTTNITVDGAPGGEREVSAFTYTGTYAAQINAYVAANAVPEPTIPVLFGGAAMLLIALRRRPLRVS